MSEIAQLLIQAEQAMHTYAWEQAQDLYQQALDLEPQHPRAQMGLRHAQQAVTKETELEERIRAADELLAGGKYHEAALEYGNIIEYAVGDPRILKFHTRLEHSRNQAKDLEAWQERVQKALQQARQQNAQGNSEAAGKIAEDMLRQLPPDPVYAQLVAALEQVRDAAVQQGDHKSLYDKAIEVLRDNDYERGIELLKMIPAESPLSTRAGQLLTQTRERQQSLERDLAPVEAALQEDRRGDALAELERVRHRYTNIPRWQRLYLQAGMGYGRALLENGRQCNTRRDFAQAIRHFSQAHTVFGQVLELYPQHPDVQPLRDECADLTTIAGFEAQAQQDASDGQREPALAAWKQAQQRLDTARSQGHDYTTVRAVVETEISRLEGEVERIGQAKQQLVNAESLWQNNHLREAHQAFQETLDALLPEHQQRAAAGLRQVEAKIRQFEEFIARGDGASDPIAAVNDYQRAYDLWPAGPEAARKLESALVNASEVALTAGRATEAVTYGKRALDLNPDSREADRCVKKAGVKPGVEATLETVRSKLAELQRGDDLRAEALAPLLSELEARLQEAGPWPELSHQLQALYDEVKALRRQWQQYEQQFARAERHRDAGNWAAALAALDEAAATLEGGAPVGVQAVRETWATIAAQTAQATQETAAAVEAGQTAYAEASALTQLSAIGDALDQVLRVLEPARKRIETLQEQATGAGGLLALALAEHQKRLEDLRARATVARDAVTTFSTSDGLLKIQEAIRMCGGDALFEAVQTQLKARAREKLAGIKQEAQNAIQVGDLIEAEEKLQQVRELDPGDIETEQLYVEIRQRRTLDERLRQIERDAESKLQSNSPVDAMETLQRGIELVLETDAPLPARAREILRRLLEVKKADYYSLVESNAWHEAQELVREFAELRRESWLLIHLVDQWLHLTRDYQQRAFIQSKRHLGNWVDAFRVACDRVKRDPCNERIVQELGECQEKLIDSLNTQATRRIHRAQRALEDGDFEGASCHLRDIWDAIYEPIEREFRGLLYGWNSIEQVRAEVAALQTQAAQLRDLHTKTTTQLEAVSQACSRGQLDEAEALLDALPAKLEADLPNLYTQVEALRAQIIRIRAIPVRSYLHKILNRIETLRCLAITPETLDAYFCELETEQHQINWVVLHPEERERYFTLLTEIREERDLLLTGVQLAVQARELAHARKYTEALQAINQALQILREAKQRVDLEILRWEVERQMHERAVVPKRAEALLQEAKRRWVQEHDKLGALQGLKEFRELVQENPADAIELIYEAGRLHERIETDHAH